MHGGSSWKLGSDREEYRMGHLGTPHLWVIVKCIPATLESVWGPWVASNGNGLSQEAKVGSGGRSLE